MEEETGVGRPRKWDSDAERKFGHGLGEIEAV